MATQMESLRWQHPVFGEVTVHCEWEEVLQVRALSKSGLWRWRVVAVEFDLFTTLVEQEALLLEIQRSERFAAKMRERVKLRSAPSRSETSDRPS